MPENIFSLCLQLVQDNPVLFSGSFEQNQVVSILFVGASTAGWLCLPDCVSLGWIEFKCLESCSAYNVQVVVTDSSETSSEEGLKHHLSHTEENKCVFNIFPL